VGRLVIVFLAVIGGLWKRKRRSRGTRSFFYLTEKGGVKFFLTSPGPERKGKRKRTASLSGEKGEGLRLLALLIVWDLREEGPKGESTRRKGKEV